MGPFAFVTICGGHDDLCVSFFFVYDVYPCESLDVSSYRYCTEIFGYSRLRITLRILTKHLTEHLTKI